MPSDCGKIKRSACPENREPLPEDGLAYQERMAERVVRAVFDTNILVDFLRRCAAGQGRAGALSEPRYQRDQLDRSYGRNNAANGECRKSVSAKFRFVGNWRRDCRVRSDFKEDQAHQAAGCRDLGQCACPSVPCWSRGTRVTSIRASRVFACPMYCESNRGGFDCPTWQPSDPRWGCPIAYNGRYPCRGGLPCSPRLSAI